MATHHYWTFFVLIGTTFGDISDQPVIGQQVLRVVPRTDQELDEITSLLSELGNDVDIWKFPSKVNHSIDFRLSSSSITAFKQSLKSVGLKRRVLIRDVGNLIERQTKRRERQARKKNSDFHNSYHTLNEIYGWIDRMVGQHPNKVSAFDVGTSYNNRPLRAIKISTSSKTPDRQAIWIQAGGHAREWISPATAMFIAEQLLLAYDDKQAIRAIVDQYDWYFLPVYNPDGYSYSWTSSRTRLWRKNRRPINFRCTGVDPNRNWDGFWGRSGSSGDPCSSTYRGPSPFSEVETKAVSDYILQKKNIIGLIDFHCYGQMWLTPWGYTADRSPNYEEQTDVSSLVVETLSWTRGTNYRYGNSPDLLYVVSGCIADWAYSKAGIIHSYILELPDTGNRGFLLPASQIIPVGIEVIDGIIGFANHLARSVTNGTIGQPQTLDDSKTQPVF